MIPLPSAIPALGAYRMSADDLAARGEWVRWLIREHCAAEARKKQEEEALRAAVLAWDGGRDLRLVVEDLRRHVEDLAEAG